MNYTKKDMESACVFEQKTVISELSEGIQMAKQLRVHLNSPEAKEFLIRKILSSYENALFLLKSDSSCGLPHSANMPLTILAESSVSSGRGEFEFEKPFFDQQGQNVLSKKRKGFTTRDDQAEITNKRKHTCNLGAQSATPRPPPSPEKYELKPTHQNQLSPPNSGEMLSNLRANLSVNTCAAIIPSLFSFPSSPFGSMGDYQQPHFPDYFDDNLLQVYLPSYISPDSSESNYFTEWGSSPSLDFSSDPADVDLDFKFDYSLF